MSRNRTKACFHALTHRSNIKLDYRNDALKPKKILYLQRIFFPIWCIGSLFNLFLFLDNPIKQIPQIPNQVKVRGNLVLLIWSYFFLDSSFLYSGTVSEVMGVFKVNTPYIYVKLVKPVLAAAPPNIPQNDEPLRRCRDRHFPPLIDEGWSIRALLQQEKWWWYPAAEENCRCDEGRGEWVWVKWRRRTGRRQRREERSELLSSLHLNFKGEIAAALIPSEPPVFTDGEKSVICPRICAH